MNVGNRTNATWDTWLSTDTICIIHSVRFSTSAGVCSIRNEWESAHSWTRGIKYLARFEKHRNTSTHWYLSELFSPQRAKPKVKRISTQHGDYMADSTKRHYANSHSHGGESVVQQMKHIIIIHPYSLESIETSFRFSKIWIIQIKA